MGSEKNPKASHVERLIYLSSPSVYVCVYVCMYSAPGGGFFDLE